MTNTFMRMFDHVEWANQQILKALYTAAESSSEKPLLLFSHLLAAEKVWLTRLQRQDSKSIKIWPSFSLEVCRQMVIDNALGYRAFISALSAEELSVVIEYRDSKGMKFGTAIQDILTHVSLHGSYHRGQINSYLRIDGLEPAVTDYILYVRQ